MEDYEEYVAALRDAQGNIVQYCDKHEQPQSFTEMWEGTWGCEMCFEQQASR